MPELKIPLRFSGIGISIPEQKVSSEELIERCPPLSSFPFRRLTGIENRRSARGVYSWGLAREAAERCIASFAEGPAAIGAVIGTSCSRMDGDGLQVSMEPSLASQLCDELGIDADIKFDVCNACAGIWTGIFVAGTLIAAKRATHVLVVSGEYVTHLGETATKEITGPADHRLACLTLGDAGAAVIVSQSAPSGEGMPSLSVRTFPGYSRYCVSKPTKEAHGGAVTTTDLMKLGSVGVQAVVSEAHRVLRNSDSRIGDLAAIIPHQTSRLNMLSAINEFGQIEPGSARQLEPKIVDILADYGNTISTSTLLAFWLAMKAGRVVDGDKVLFAMAGAGITIGVALYDVGSLPSRLHAPQDRCVPSIPDRANPIFEGIEIVGRACLPRIAAASAMDMSVAAAIRALATANIGITGVDLVLFAGVYRQDNAVEPAMAVAIAGELGITGKADAPGSVESVLAFDVGGGAVGIQTALSIASALVDVFPAATILVVASEYDTNPDLGAAPIGIDEGACAFVIRKTDDRYRSLRGQITFARGTATLLGSRSRQGNGGAIVDRHADPLASAACTELICTALLDLKDCGKSHVVVLAEHLSEADSRKVWAALTDVKAQESVLHCRIGSHTLDCGLLLAGHFERFFATSPSEEVVVIQVGSGVSCSVLRLPVIDREKH
ncbi:3-oxoacyl-[acyl-carrier-protein] synthase III C-terminal domain-containing protein [Sphingobium subterraneum]|uniref:3-oxoacyl-[acyl-carrier-protein] synthase III n=1 Tax=Sphingobium subterraneum TaxID=627688 RepID=A0A841IX68_9SPHN|nr:3-oxoacyl-[acyl-carrier-protein] synthase III C-terminal domain-containing protein [Sphingobium subterraneum]MBB6122880.1 3-oxoacyl-[acyl-carrier-protein] synthase III [Sphingobium subterraneum]